MTQQTPTQARPDAGQLLKSAASAQPIRAAELKLEAAKLLLAQGDKQRAMQVLAEIDTRPLPPSLAFDISRLRADQALQANDGQSALYYLDRAQLPPSRITSYNVCYTKLLRRKASRAPRDNSG